MNISSYPASVCSKVATQFKTQNGTIPRRALKASLFCAIVIALSIVQLNPAVAQRNNGVAVLGPNTSYPCTTAGITNAIAAAVAATTSTQVPGITQSVVDASNCAGTPNGNTSTPGLVITSPIYVGVRPAPGVTPSANQRIKLILPANGLWQTGSPWTDPNHYGYAFMWGDGAMIYGGTGSGEGQPFTILHSGLSNTTLTAVCGNDPGDPTTKPPTPGASYFHAEGFSCVAGMAVSAAVIEINGGQDESYMGHVTAAVDTGAAVPRALWIHAACCSATFEDINAEAGNNPSPNSTLPCQLGDFNGSIHVSQLSCVHPSPGQSALLIQQSGSGVNNGVGSSYKDIYVEEGSGGDTVTPYVTVAHLSGTFVAADLLDGLRADRDAMGSTTRCMVDVKAGSHVNIANLSLSDVNPSQNISMCAIYDETGASPVSINGPQNSVIASYDMAAPRYLGAMTVGSLPPASANNAGAMFRVTDAAITSEGQACVSGGSSGKNALAFSDGTIWKCF